MATAGIVAGAHWVENNAGIRAYLEADPGLYAALFASAEPALAYARSIAPVLTGAYRASIQVERNPADVGLRFFSDDRKAHWIEYGAKHMPRYRVLGRAIDRISTGSGGAG